MSDTLNDGDALAAVALLPETRAQVAPGSPPSRGFFSRDDLRALRERDRGPDGAIPRGPDGFIL